MRLPVLPASTITPYAFGFWAAAWLPHANSTTATDAATRYMGTRPILSTVVAGSVWVLSVAVTVTTVLRLRPVRFLAQLPYSLALTAKRHTQLSAPMVKLPVLTFGLRGYCTSSVR